MTRLEPETRRLGILLAAGSSERMGKSKQTLRLGEHTLVEWCLIHLLEGGVGRVCVVTSEALTKPLERLPPDARVRVVRNPNPEAGMSSSIRVGLESLLPDTNSIVIALSDMPFIDPRTIRAVVEAREASGAAVALPVYRGRDGHPVVWDAAVACELAALSGPSGARSLLSRYGEQRVSCPVDDDGVCYDIDTPDDFERARKRLGSRGR